MLTGISKLVREEEVNMCSIGGYSLVEGSVVNARQLAHNLLVTMEARGTDAAGFAFTLRDGSQGAHKAAVRGGQLPLKGLPRDADSVILHTRMWTTGKPSDNNNNHPLSSPDGNIRLVHNGVIYNHDEVRVDHGFDTLPEVDSAVIPAVLSRFGVQGLDYLAGDAALVWLDDSTANTIHIARPSRNPVVYARLLDGSIVFASTRTILGAALKASKLEWYGGYPAQFHSLAEGEYLTLTNGEFVNQSAVGWNDNYWTKPYSSSGVVDKWLPEGYDDDGDDDEIPGGFDSDGMWRDSSILDRYYLLDHAGDYEGFTSLHSMLSCVFWYCEVSGGRGLVDADDDLSWINHIADVGSISVDGELSSWSTDFPTDLVDLGGAVNIYDGLRLLNGVGAAL